MKEYLVTVWRNQRQPFTMVKPILCLQTDMFMPLNSRMKLFQKVNYIAKNKILM